MNAIGLCIVVECVKHMRIQLDRAETYSKQMPGELISRLTYQQVSLSAGDHISR